jgi:hypothetical protein
VPLVWRPGSFSLAALGSDRHTGIRGRIGSPATKIAEAHRVARGLPRFRRRLTQAHPARLE